MSSSQGIYDVTSVSFAYDANGNGYALFSFRSAPMEELTFTTNLGGRHCAPGHPRNSCNSHWSRPERLST